MLRGRRVVSMRRDFASLLTKREPISARMGKEKTKMMRFNKSIEKKRTNC